MIVCLGRMLSRRMGEGSRPSPVLLEVLLRRCFQLCLPRLSMNLSWIHGRLQSFGSMRPLHGDSSDQDSHCDTQNRHRPMDTDNLQNNLVHTVVQGGPVGPQGIEPLALLVCDHADPAGQHAVIQKKLLGPAGPKVKEPLAL